MNDGMLAWYATIGVTALGAAAGGMLLRARWLAQARHRLPPPEEARRRERTLPLPMRRRQPPANPQATIPISKLAELQLTTHITLKKQVTARPPTALPAAHPTGASLPTEAGLPSFLDMFQPVTETAYPTLVAGADWPSPALQPAVVAAEAPPAPAASLPAAQPQDPAPAGWLLAESIAQVRQGRLDQAEQSLRCLLEADPRQPNAWFWMGWLSARRGQLAIAQHCFERAHHLHHPQASRSIEWCRQHSGEMAPRAPAEGAGQGG